MPTFASDSTVFRWAEFRSTKSGIRIHTQIDIVTEIPVFYRITNAKVHDVNWKDTHRITAGVGFSFDKFRLDLAYQYSMRKGDFYPFMKDLSATVDLYDENGVKTGTFTESNSCSSVNVKDNRHQIQASLTYTF